MKAQKWLDSIDEAKDFLEASAVLPEEGSGARLSVRDLRSHLTKLRHRIEERLDSKRIAHEFDDEFDYDDLEEQTDRLQ